MVQNNNKLYNKEKRDENNNNLFIDSIKNYHYQQLTEEIQKLKNENKRLFLKNNELSLKLRTQEAKAKINNNSDIPKKKLSDQKEEFYLQKIRQLESEIIKQKDLITKLTYNKRYNIGIRKIRVASLIIKGNIMNPKNYKIKRRNSISACNKINTTINYNNTLPNNISKYKNRKRSSNSIDNSIKTSREEINMSIRPLLSTTHSIEKKIKNKNIQKLKNKKTGIGDNYNKTNLSVNNSSCGISYHNREKSINIKFDDNIFKGKVKNIKKNNNSEKSNIANMKENKNKKMKTKKMHGKTNLIMSVINDNLLGNFDYSEFINQHFSNLCNKTIKNKKKFKN